MVAGPVRCEADGCDEADDLVYFADGQWFCPPHLDLIVKAEFGDEPDLPLGLYQRAEEDRDG